MECMFHYMREANLPISKETMNFLAANKQCYLTKFYLGSWRETKACLLGLLLLLPFEQNAISINFLNAKIYQKKNIK